MKQNRNTSVANTGKPMNIVSVLWKSGHYSLNLEERKDYFISSLHYFFKGEDVFWLCYKDDEIIHEIMYQENCFYKDMPYVGIRYNGKYYLRKKLVYVFLKWYAKKSNSRINVPIDVYFQDLVDIGIIEHGVGLDTLHGVPMPNVDYFALPECLMEVIEKPPCTINPMEKRLQSWFEK